MVEYDRTQEREYAQQARAKICVAGVGGAGLNVLDRISLDRIMEGTLVGMHTDVRVLSHAMAPCKIQLGSELMRGIGSGGDPELGREAAQLSRDQIKSAVQGHEMVFICCGLGGGTGSGAAPVVAEIAKECGAMVVVFATMPFAFEGRRRLRQGELALEELQQTADALVLFENNRMGELILPKEGIQKAFSQADQLMGQSVRAISSMVTQPGLVRVGIADLMTALRSPNARCLFGFGEARGANRVSEALKRALKSPLVNQGQLLQSARNLLVHVAGGESLSLAEVESLMKQLGKHVPENTQILFGLSVDQKLGDSIALTLLSSLSAQEMALEASVEKVVVKPEARAAATFAPILESVTDLPATNGNGKHKQAPAAVPVAKAQPVKQKPAAEPATPVTAQVPAPVMEPAPIADLFAASIEALEPALKAPPLTLKTETIVVEAPKAEPEPVAEPEAVIEEVIQVKVEEPVALVEPEPMAVVEPEAVALAEPEPEPEPEVVAEIPPVIPVPVRPQVVAVTQTEIDARLTRSAFEVSGRDTQPVVLPVQKTVQAVAEDISAQKKIPDHHSLLNAILRPVADIPASPPPQVKSSFVAIPDDDEDEMEEEQPVSHHATPPPPQPPPLKSVQPVSTQHEILQRAPKENEVVARVPAQTPSASRKPLNKVSSDPIDSDYEQSSLKLTQEEIARFKGTEKTIVGGEDLDVPTWMRMKQKVRR